MGVRTKMAMVLAGGIIAGGLAGVFAGAAGVYGEAIETGYNMAVFDECLDRTRNDAMKCSDITKQKEQARFNKRFNACMDANQNDVKVCAGHPKGADMKLPSFADLGKTVIRRLLAH